MVIKLKVMYSHFTYGQTHDTYFAQNPWVDKTSGNTNHKGPKKMWVPKNKKIYILDILSNTIETSIMVHGLWVPSEHDGKNVFVPRVGT